MREQQDRAQVQQAIDRTLSGLTGDPFLFQQLTIRAGRPEKGASPMRFNKLAILLAAVLLMSAATAAVAGELMGYTVNWEGEPISTAKPWPKFEPWEGYDEAIALLGTIPKVNMEHLRLVPLDPDDPAIFYGRSPAYYAENLDDLNARLAKIGYFPQITGIPEGFFLNTKSVEYRPAYEGAYESTGSTHFEKYTLNRYNLPVENATAIGYTVQFRPNDDPDNYEAAIGINAFIEYSDPIEGNIRVLDGETAHPITVPGMDRAIAVTSSASTTLVMYRALETSVPYYDTDGGNNRVVFCKYLSIRVTAPAMPLEDIIALFDLE